MPHFIAILLGLANPFPQQGHHGLNQFRLLLKNRQLHVWEHTLANLRRDARKGADDVGGSLIQASGLQSCVTQPVCKLSLPAQNLDRLSYRYLNPQQLGEATKYRPLRVSVVILCAQRVQTEDLISALVAPAVSRLTFAVATHAIGR
jgi:hypothetical protein